MNQAGVVTEKVWFNFEPDRIHWARHAGRDFTHRQTVKRKAQSWGRRYRVQVRCDLDSHGLVSLAPALCESSIVIFAFRSRLQAAFLPPGTAPRSP